jgi:hypothetical protein
MKKETKGLLINSKEKTIKEISFSGHYWDIHEQLGNEVEAIDSMEFTNGDHMFYELQDESESDCGFIIDDQFFKGNLLIVGDHYVSTNENNQNPRFKSCKFSLKTAKSEIHFPQDIGLYI